MKTLHTVQPVLFSEEDIIWYGANQPLCPSRYHRGYDDERTSASDHNQCAEDVFRALRPDLFSITGWYCNCITCLEARQTTPHRERAAHYYFTHAHSDPNHQQTFVPDAGRYLCWACRADIHPTPTERPIP